MHLLRPAALSLTIALAACNVGRSHFDLVYSVFPTEEGADVIVGVRGGPPAEVWVGFGLGPGAASQSIERVHSVQAHDRNGRPLAIEPVGDAGFRVAAPGSEWSLRYSLHLRPDSDEDIFYRTSTRGDDYLVLVGSDAWARFFESPQPLAYGVTNRPPGFVDRARVVFNLTSRGDAWSVVTDAPTAGPNAYLLQEHPVGTVFALGPYRRPAPAPGSSLQLAVHRDWRVLAEQTPGMVGSMVAAIEGRVGEAAPRGVAVLQPLPPALAPRVGLRTAGMVRGSTAILYAGATPAALARPDRLAETLSVFVGHELFHLFVLSAIAVTRDLAWLSEGWAMHMGRLAAEDAGWITARTAATQLRDAYQRYLRIGGYRAGSLPAASMGSDSQRDLLYLRGELVFRLLALEFQRGTGSDSFDQTLWQRLRSRYDGRHPLDREQVRQILESLLGDEIVRRYVEGQAPLTPAALGLPH